MIVSSNPDCCTVHLGLQGRPVRECNAKELHSPVCIPGQPAYMSQSLHEGAGSHSIREAVMFGLEDGCRTQSTEEGRFSSVRTAFRSGRSVPGPAGIPSFARSQPSSSASTSSLPSRFATASSGVRPTQRRKLLVTQFSTCLCVTAVTCFITSGSRSGPSDSSPGAARCGVFRLLWASHNFSGVCVTVRWWTARPRASARSRCEA